MQPFSNHKQSNRSSEARALWQRVCSALRENGGAELVEWIGWMAIVMITLGALMALYFASASGAQMGRAVECEIAEWASEWSGAGAGDCSGGGGMTAGPIGGVPGDAADVIPVFVEPPMPPLPGALDDADYLEEDLPEGRPINPKTGEGYEQAPDDPELEDELCEDQSIWGAMRQVWNGFVTDGLWEDVKGVWELIVDVAKYAWGTVSGGTSDDEVIEKYSAVLGAIFEHPEQVLLALFEKPIEDWENGCYVAALSNGVYMLLSLVAPGDELAKVVRLLPDELARVITTISRMNVDELLTLLNRAEDLTPEELAAIYRRLEKMTPEELADAGITAEKLEELGYSDEAIEAIQRKNPCAIGFAPIRKPPGLAKTVFRAELSAGPCGIPTRPFAHSNDLNRNVIEQMYRGEWVNGQWVSIDSIPGGLAGAIRRELANPGTLVGGTSHIRKGEQRLTQLKSILRDGSYRGQALDAHDLDIVRRLHDDLQRALQGD